MRWFAALLLALYAGFVARLTLAVPSDSRAVFSAANYWFELFSGGRLDGAQIEMLSNVALFVPAGLLLAIVLQRPFLTVALCVLASVCIEVMQRLWFSYRIPDVADVVHNGYGAVIGVLIFAVTGWVIRWLNGSSNSAGQPA